jgi:hypothetical protein
VANVGYLPTYVLGSAQSLPDAQPVTLRASISGGKLHSPASPVAVGHLDGWGQGLHDGDLFMPRSRGSQHASFDFLVSGTGQLRLEAGSPRTGSAVLEIELD